MAASTTEPKKKYTCTRCKKTMSELKFYSLRNGEKDNICKECLCAHVNNFEPETFLWILERYDVPYLPSEWNVLRDRAYQQDHKKIGGAAVVGKYLGKFKLKQWIDPETKKPYTWADSARLQAERCAEVEMTEEDIKAEQERLEELKKAFEEGTISEAEFRTLSNSETQKEYDDINDFPGASTNALDDFDKQYISEDELPNPGDELTDDDKIYLAVKWGRLYTPNEWVALEQKYTEMMDSFDIQDADSRNTLILICKTDLKMNQAIDCGDIEGYQKLTRVSDSLRKSAKFTAAQNKDKDNEQVDCVGVLVAMCEQLGGFIPNELPEDASQDKIDISMEDTRKYLYNLVTKDLGFGQQIENYLKKIQLEHDNLVASESDEVEEITDENIAEYYERIEEEKLEDSQVTEDTTAYNRKKDD